VVACIVGFFLDTGDSSQKNLRDVDGLRENRKVVRNKDGTSLL
jgi:hypothetical protein